MRIKRVCQQRSINSDKVTDDIDKPNDMMAGIAVQGAGTSGATKKEYIQALLYVVLT